MAPGEPYGRDQISDKDEHDDKSTTNATVVSTLPVYTAARPA